MGAIKGGSGRSMQGGDWALAIASAIGGGLSGLGEARQRRAENKLRRDAIEARDRAIEASTQEGIRDRAFKRKQNRLDREFSEAIAEMRRRDAIEARDRAIEASTQEGIREREFKRKQNRLDRAFKRKQSEADRETSLQIEAMRAAGRSGGREQATAGVSDADRLALQQYVVKGDPRFGRGTGTLLYDQDHAAGFGAIAGGLLEEAATNGLGVSLDELMAGDIDEQTEQALAQAVYQRVLSRMGAVNEDLNLSASAKDRMRDAAGEVAREITMDALGYFREQKVLADEQQLRDVMARQRALSRPQGQLREAQFGGGREPQQAPPPDDLWQVGPFAGMTLGGPNQPFPRQPRPMMPSPTQSFGVTAPQPGMQIPEYLRAGVGTQPQPMPSLMMGQPPPEGITFGLGRPRLPFEEPNPYMR